MRMGIEGVSAEVVGVTLFLSWGECCVVGLEHERLAWLADGLGLAGEHCALDWGASGARVFDLGSGEQTRVNGEVISMATLSDGDVLELGRVRFRIHVWPWEGTGVERVSSPLRGMVATELAEGRLFVLVDGAAAEHLARQVKGLGVPYASLYRGTAEESLEEVAPYLVDVSGCQEAAEALILPAWGKRQVLLIRPEGSFDAVRRQLRRFLFVEDRAGERVYFRFADPVVMQRFLLASTEEEWELFLRDMEEVVMESEDRPGEVLRLGHMARARREPICSS